MISVRGLSRCRVNDQQRFARFDHYLAPADFRAFDESVEGLQRSQFVMLRVDSLDAFDCGLERKHQAAHLRMVYCWIFSPSFSSKLDACELINGIPQQWCRIIFDGLNDAGKNHCKLHLQWSRRKVLCAAKFLRLRGHVKTRLPLANFLNQSPLSLPATATGGFCFGPAVSIINFNGLAHCVFADQAPTYPAADRRKTKPSGREARARLGGHDPPTPRDRAERSARA